MSHRTSHPQTNRQIFAWPAAIGCAAIAGLVLGLTGDGLRDLAAWILVGLAPIIIVAALLRRSS